MRPLFHVSIAIFLWRGARNLAIFGDESRFELFDLLVILDNLTFDFWDDILGARLRYILLRHRVRIVNRLCLTAI